MNPVIARFSLLRIVVLVVSVTLMLLGVSIPSSFGADDGRVFELRVYTAHEGKLDDLHSRFRETTNPLFVKHGIALIGYWTPTDGERSGNTLIYVVGHQSREAAKAAWEAFREDPEWKAGYAASIENGKLVSKVESTYMKATDYSPVQ